jgi:hypothetical protein
MRRDRLAVALAALGLVAVLAVAVLDRPAGAERTPSVLRARTIELVDGRGQVRAQMKVERDGEVVFRLRDQDGAVRAKLGASRAGSGLLLLNEATEPGVQARAGADGTSVSLQRGAERNELVP